MIEKLKPTVRGFDDVPSMPTATDFLNKINELIDVVNTHQTNLNNHTCRLVALENKENKDNPAVPYAKQCKWRGKLCKFWNDKENPEDCVYGILRNVFDVCPSDCPFQCGDGLWYEHCEPVSEDLIYKGEQNERS